MVVQRDRPTMLGQQPADVVQNGALGRSAQSSRPVDTAAQHDRGVSPGRRRRAGGSDGTSVLAHHLVGQRVDETRALGIRSSVQCRGVDRDGARATAAADEEG